MTANTKGTLLKRLEPGDCIGIVAPSFWLEKQTAANIAFNRLETRGYTLCFGQEVFRRHQYTTDTPKERARSITQMFKDTKIKAIICLDGGCGSIEVLPYLDYETIAANPKIFSGFSDVTHINIALFAKTHLPSLYGMDIINGFSADDALPIAKLNEDFFFQCASNSSQIGNLPAFSGWEIWRAGSAEGTLIGGWLEGIANVAGTEYFPADREIILFWETLDLEINEINSHLNRLKIAGVMSRVRGMMIGKLKNCEEKEYWDCFPSLRDLILKLTETENFPIIANVDFGHGKEHISIPVGLRARIDTEQKLIKVIDALIQ